MKISRLYLPPTRKISYDRPRHIITLYNTLKALINYARIIFWIFIFLYMYKPQRKWCLGILYEYLIGFTKRITLRADIVKQRTNKFETTNVKYAISNNLKWGRRQHPIYGKLNTTVTSRVLLYKFFFSYTFIIACLQRYHLIFFFNNISYSRHRLRNITLYDIVIICD